MSQDRQPRSDADTRRVRDAEQSLAQIAHASAEIATMYKTLLDELKEATAALALTIAWIQSVAAAGVYAANQQRDRERES